MLTIIANSPVITGILMIFFSTAVSSIIWKRNFFCTKTITEFSRETKTRKYGLKDALDFPFAVIGYFGFYALGIGLLLQLVRHVPY